MPRVLALTTVSKQHLEKHVNATVSGWDVQHDEVQTIKLGYDTGIGKTDT